MLLGNSRISERRTDKSNLPLSAEYCRLIDEAIEPRIDWGLGRTDLGERAIRSMVSVERTQYALGREQVGGQQERGGECDGVKECAVDKTR